jgi:hypothetical protein
MRLEHQILIVQSVGNLQRSGFSDRFERSNPGEVE